MTTLKISEKFKSVQGEGCYTGAPMAFIRLVGCSVGKKICQHCDTDFEAMHSWRGGGEFSPHDLIQWARPYGHICLTGGEPLDADPAALNELCHWAGHFGITVHVETSGTVPLPQVLVDMQAVGRAWICVSPKPGFLETVIEQADEVKVIVPGLGTSESLKALRVLDGHDVPTHPYGARETFRWPTLEDAKRWAFYGKVVFLQPRNGRTEVDQHNLRIVQDLLAQHPELRLSVQFHKILKVQ